MITIDLRSQFAKDNPELFKTVVTETARTRIISAISRA